MLKNDDKLEYEKDEKKDKILKFINSDEYNPMKIKHIMEFMEVPEKDRTLFLELIDELLVTGKIILTKKEKVSTPARLNMFSGTYLSNSKGFGFVTPDDESGSAEDIFISSNMSNGAMHKDKVIYKIIKTKRGKKQEGEIVKVIKRGYSLIVGTFEQSKNFGFVVPDEKRFDKDIFISKNKTMGAVTGHKVVVKIIKPAQNGKKPEGQVVEILGHINDPGVDILSIIKQFELPTDFPEEVYEEAEKILDYITEDELKGRLDLRNEKTVTIDGEDAKDLDDAISITKLENGNFKLGVHIADVTHYVKEGSNLDKEAINRGTSVYLVDRVIPMLPHKLSNGICSLNAGVDRLALSCFMEIDKKGDVVSHNICETIIKVNKRMSYTIVNDLLTNKNSDFLQENLEFMEMFYNMKELRDILFNKRKKRGSIEFDFKEVKIILDENRKPIDILPYNRNIATSIIEEFMLIANETVAEYYFWLELPFVYRSHEEPDLEKVEKLSTFIGKFGYVLKGNSTHSKSFQKIILKCKDKPEEMLINRIVLRSLKQAKYTPKNEGHFGLAAKYYCHFTSPIRRYPDLQIHRIIKQNLNNELSNSKIKVLDRKIPEIALKSSNRERVAEEAERETIQLKKVEFMQGKEGEEFTGLISSVTSWGIYVELPNTVEGMISIKNMDDDFYFYDEDNMQYVGEHTNKVYSLGDKVKVILTRVNLQERTLDFDFAEKYK